MKNPAKKFRCQGCRREVEMLMQILVEDAGLHVEVTRCRPCIEFVIERLNQFQNARKN